MTNSSDNNQQRIPPKLVTEAWLRTYEIKGTGVLRILSGSMAPLINTGDQIVIEKIEPAQVGIGDIITFWRNDILITHRVIRKFKKDLRLYFIERADTSLYHSVVDAQTVIGRVIKINKGDDHEIVFNTVSWRIFNLMVGIGFLASSSIYDLGNKMRWVPRPIRRCIGKFFVAAKYVQKKVLYGKMNNV
jgi:signal peptidase I